MAPPPRPTPAKTSILDTLNEAQRRAVSSNAATVAILAGPGSGKTHTLTSRVVWLIDSLGYQPQDVLVSTFTVKAAREMQERLGKALGDGRERKIILGTFHSIARRYLAAYGQKIGLNQKFGIADDADSRAIISRICKRLRLTCEPPKARSWISKKKSKGTKGRAELKRENSSKTPMMQELETCYEEYQAQLERSNLLDYDDLLVRCVELLRGYPSCVSNVQAVLIDEYQDTNGVQYELMRLFAQRHRRITIVGDPDQSIYGWRSAEVENLHRLLQDYPGTKEVALEQNYRSSQLILENALLVIEQDTKRYDKKLKAVHNRGARPVLRKLRTAAMEAEWIVSEIRRATLMSGDMIKNSDVAILLRSAALSRHIESALGKSGIAYRMVGGFKFYDRVEIKLILDYLRVIHQPENNDALARILNVPRRGIGDGTVKNLVEEAEKSSMSLWDLLTKHCRGNRIAKTKITKQAEQKLSGELIRMLSSIRKKIQEIADGTPFGLVEIIQQLITSLNLRKHLQDNYQDDHEQRWANIQEFFNLAADFVRDLHKIGDDSLPEIEGLQQSKEIDVLPQFLANVSLASDVQTGDDEHENTPLVTISTIHAAKGLEWPIVFVPAAYNGSIPHIRSEDSDEERRLLYVAMTRAQALLYLSYPSLAAANNCEHNEVSPFLAQVARCFSKKGASFDRPVMEQISRVLRRHLPPNKTIYENLPSMFSPEDILFPEDPDKERHQYGHSGNMPWMDESLGGAENPRKRARVTGPVSNAQTSEEPPWKKEYSTTMEQSSAFSVASLPGFVSAGKHQAAMAVAAQANHEAQKASRQGMKRSLSHKATNQRSITSFVRSTSASGFLGENGISNGNVASKGTVTTQQNVRDIQITTQERPGIAPGFAAHKLGPASGKLLSRPKNLRNEADEGGPIMPYTCFSSSPPRPAAADQTVADDVENKDTNTEEEPPPKPMRPAACLHATTCSMPFGVGGGIRRPAGLARGAIAPIEKLRKPFRPLTMNRPSRP